MGNRDDACACQGIDSLLYMGIYLCSCEGGVDTVWPLKNWLVFECGRWYVK